MDQKGALALGALAGAAAAVLLRRRAAQPRPVARPVSPPVSPPPVSPPPDEDLRRRLDEARAAAVDEAEFQAAGMGAETIVTEDLRSGDVTEDLRPGESSPAREFEAMNRRVHEERRRVHEEGRATAEEMRRQAETDA